MIEKVDGPLRSRQFFDELGEVALGPPHLGQCRCDALCVFLLLPLAANAVPYGSRRSRFHVTSERCRDLRLSSLAEIAAACRLARRSGNALGAGVREGGKKWTE